MGHARVIKTAPSNQKASLDFWNHHHSITLLTNVPTVPHPPKSTSLQADLMDSIPAVKFLLADFDLP